ncbi:hypothetical protein ACPCSE_29440 [Streptomyces cellulosae]
MRMRDLEPLMRYATKGMKRSSRLPSGPALLLDMRLWDLVPGVGGPSFSLAPEGTRQGVLNEDTGARRGLLVVQVTPATVFAPGYDPSQAADLLEDVAEQPEAQTLASLLDPEDLDNALARLRGSLPDSLTLTVLFLESFVEPLGHSKRYRCPGCGKPVALDSADRIRAHTAKDGATCSVTHTYMPSEERQALLITHQDRP